MKEYTLLAILAALAVVLLDVRILKTRVLQQRTFWVFLGVMYVFKAMVNGYLTWRPIVNYDERFFSGLRLGTIPLEDFVYGFALVTLTIVLWEYLKKRFQGSAQTRP